MNSTFPSSASSARRRLTRTRSCAAMLASVMAVGYALPISSALAESPPPVGGVLGVVDPSGLSVGPLNGLTLTQLAALLGISPGELVAKIDALPGYGEVSALLDELLANPEATLQNVINDVNVSGVNPEPVQQLINSLLGGVVENSSQLQRVLTTVLSGLSTDGLLGKLADELEVPVGVLEEIGLIPVNDEELAGTLDTTTENVGDLLTGADAISKPPGLGTPLVDAAVPGSTLDETKEIVGTLGSEQGLTLTTVSSTPGPAGPAGRGGTAGAPGPAGPAAVAAAARPAATISNAFTVVSIKRAKSGLVVETVKLPGAGRLAIGGTAKETVANVARDGRSKTAKRTIKFATLGTDVGGGTRAIALYPQINPRNRIVVSLTTTFKPTGGAANAKHSAATLKATTSSRTR